MRFKLILSSVKTDITDNIVDAAKEAGATGATIIPARGMKTSFSPETTDALAFGFF